MYFLDLFDLYGLFLCQIMEDHLCSRKRHQADWARSLVRVNEKAGK